eukprot:gene7054-7801_t
MELIRSLSTRQSSSCQTITFDKLFSTEEEVEALGKALASVVGIGDSVLLTGDLGAGKTTFSRGMVRAKCDDPEMRVTSPSYLLDNVYYLEDQSGAAGQEVKLHHMDLYRLPSGSDMGFLSIPEIFTSAICLIEWPERLRKEDLPRHFLEVNLRISSASPNLRLILLHLVGPSWIERRKLIENALAKEGLRPTS